MFQTLVDHSATHGDGFKERIFYNPLFFMQVQPPLSLSALYNISMVVHQTPHSLQSRFISTVTDDCAYVELMGKKRINGLNFKSYAPLLPYVLKVTI